jgi:hypothetical protein
MLIVETTPRGQGRSGLVGPPRALAVLKKESEDGKVAGYGERAKRIDADRERSARALGSPAADLVAELTLHVESRSLTRQPKIFGARF